MRWVYKSFQIICCWILLQSSALAESAVLEVDGLMAANQWREAAKIVFLEAKRINPHDSRIAIAQAKAGLIDDALESVNELYPDARSSALLSIVRNSPILSFQKEQQLLQQALYWGRRNSDKPYTDGFKSGELASIALYYSAKGMEDKAKLTFAEAINDAQSGLMADDSSGFRRITDLLRKAPVKQVKSWMLSDIYNALIHDTDSLNRAFGCIDMVAVSARLKNRGLMNKFTDCANSAIRQIEHARRKNNAIEALGLSQIEMKGFVLPPSTSPILEAIRHARSGQIEKSYEMISGFGENLYVSHKSYAYGLIFDDAIKRGDLHTAQYFAQRGDGDTQISIWQSLAEKQFELKSQSAAVKSYTKALTAAKTLNVATDVNLFNIHSLVRLGQSLIQHGMKEEGYKTLTIARSSIDKISPMNMEDRVLASIAVSDAFWHNGWKRGANDLIRQAYFDAHSYDTTQPFGEMRKLDLLVSIGESIGGYTTLKSND